MLAQRKLPFGYCIRHGKISIVDDEAALVREIFTNYAAGISYGKLVSCLNAQPIPYYDPDKPWNKNMVARILASSSYTGQSGYPPIMTSALFAQAQAAKPVPKVQTSELEEAGKEIRIFVRCASCEKHLQRNWRANWICPACMRKSINIPDTSLMSETRMLIAELIRKPGVIDAECHVSTSDALSQIQTAFEAEVNRGDFDEDSAKEKAITLAATRIQCLGTEDYETMRIRYILANISRNGKNDMALLRQIVSSVLVNADGEVSLKLKNRQTVDRSILCQ